MFLKILPYFILGILLIACTPKIVTNTVTVTDTLRLESIKEVRVMETVIDSASFDSLLFEFSELQNRIVTPDTRIVIQERIRVVKEQIIKSILPDTTYTFSIPFKLSSPDSTFQSELEIIIAIKDGRLTHYATSDPVKIPYTESTYEFSITKLNAWSKWIFVILVIGLGVSVKKWFF